MVIVKFLWLIGSETVHGAKCHQAEWDCPSSIHHSILWDPVPRLQNFHQWAIVSHLVNAKRHHVCYTGALWKCSGTSISLQLLADVIGRTIKAWNFSFHLFAGGSITNFVLHLSAWGARMQRKHDTGLQLVASIWM